MSWFSKRPPEPESPAPIDGWTLTFQMSDGSVSKIDGHCYNEAATAEQIRAVDAMVDGLRAAGFRADASVTRKTVEPR